MELELERRCWGNTIPSTFTCDQQLIDMPRDSQAINWCFTFDNWTVEQYGEVELLFPQHAKYCFVDKEKGEKGTLHLQGNLQLNKRLRFNQVRNLFSLWRKQESMPNKTLSTAAKRKISMNGDNQQEQEKDQTWNRYPRLFKKAKRSVKLLSNFQQPSSSSTEESENLNLSSQ